jgi:hypothetical protein
MFAPESAGVYKPTCYRVCRDGNVYSGICEGRGDEPILPNIVHNASNLYGVQNR